MGLRKLLLLGLAHMAALSAAAYDFEAGGIYYTINDDGVTVSVTYASTSYNSYSGDVTVPETATYDGSSYTVSAVGSYAFYKSTALTSVELPSSVTSIGDYAFFGCTGLSGIEIPGNVASIGSFAFRNCSGVSTFILPEGLETIATYLFGGCTSLTTVSIPSSVKTIERYAFCDCTSLTELTIPDQVTSLGEFLFWRCSGLESAMVGKGVTSLPNSIFRDCTGLKSVTLPAGITTFGNYTFQSCYELVGVVLPDSLTTIGTCLFNDCTSLTEVTFPAKVSSIGNNAFNGCDSLTAVTSLNPTPPTVTSATFNSTVYSNATLYVPQGCLSVYGEASYWNKFETIREFGVEATGHNYTIGTADEWNSYAADYSSFTSLDTITITADLDFTGVAITPFSRFYGELDGQGHTITINDTTASGYTGALFGSVYSDAYIHDFTVAGTLGSSFNYCGVVAGYMYGRASGITSSVTLTATGTYNSGMFGYASDATLTSCGNTGSLTSSSNYLTGLVAYVKGSLTLDSCYNTGDIAGAGYVAGLVGFVSSISSPVTLSDCVNTGSIDGTGNFLGGLVSVLPTSTTSSLTLTRCHNTGRVTTSSAKGFCVAGLVGCCLGGSYFDECYNAGDITGAYYVGGLLSYAYSNGNSFTDCFNTGDITGTSADYGYVGGITGQSSATTMTNVYNTGNVTSAYTMAGGLVGDTDPSYALAVSGAYSTGTVTTNGNKGCLIGCGSTISSSNVTLTNAYVVESASSGEAVDTDYITSLSNAELAKLDLGDGWTAGDDYTYPRLTTLADNDYAKAHAAAVVPAEGDTYSSITQDFYVGASEGVIWTASSDAISFDGNIAAFTASVTGVVTLTATCGEATAETEITCNVETGGVEMVTGGERMVVSEKIYTVGGRLIDSPPAGAIGVYIVVKTLDDGSVRVDKETRWSTQ